jgi:putative ABC transport system permease protein
MTSPLAPSRLRPADVLRVGAVGLRTRPLRALLSALGIAIGIAAMVAVVGISSSSRADLDRELAALGTNLLTVSPGQNLFGEPAQLPDTSVTMISWIAPVESVTATGEVPGARVYRNDRVPAVASGGIAVLATRTDLAGTVGATVSSGTFLNKATAGYPVTVLGAAAAHRLGVGAAGTDQQVFLGGQWFTVAGVLAPVPLAPELDNAALVGWPEAEQQLGFDGHPTTIYTRVQDDQVGAVRSVLAATTDPASPNEVGVSRPSDALAAQQATDTTLSGMLLGLGAVALLVGGVGVANTMVISVLERRGEIGLRRALGATRGHVRLQFVTESLLLSGLGGLAGVLLGTTVTTGYAAYQSWPTVVPAWATLGGLAATTAIGAAAGLYPAIRASHLSPTEALAVP